MLSKYLSEKGSTSHKKKCHLLHDVSMNVPKILYRRLNILNEIDACLLLPHCYSLFKLQVVAYVLTYQY